MNARVGRVVGAVLVMLAAGWVGWQVYAGRSGGTPATGTNVPVLHNAGLGPPVHPVPVGEASAPTHADLTDAGDATAGLQSPATIPAQVPEFTLGDRAGKPTSVATWRGKSLIINFWATWCAPCRHEIPLLQSLYGEWRGREVEVIGIAVDRREAVLAYAKEMNMTYPLLVGDQDALDVVTAFGVQTPVFPFSVFTDRRGDVVAVYVGELHRPEAEFILAVVDILNQARVPLDEARRRIAGGLRDLQRTPG